MVALIYIFPADILFVMGIYRSASVAEINLPANLKNDDVLISQILLMADRLV